jgi:hypothetical protein
VEYDDLIETLKDICESGMSIPEKSFINTFELLKKQDLIYVDAPFYKQYILSQRRIIYIVYNELSTYITAMSVEVYNKENGQSNSIIFNITEGIVKVIGISNKAKNGLLIVANLEELNKVAR